MELHLVCTQFVSLWVLAVSHRQTEVWIFLELLSNISQCFIYLMTLVLSQIV
jgi:hypothetical protein